MSVAEKIGRFIIAYQFEVEIALGLLVALIVMVLSIKAMRNSKKKRELLSQINDTVSEINSTVNGMGNKKSDVIYIDNRASKGDTKVDLFSREIDEPEPEEMKPEPEETITATDCVEDSVEDSESGQVKYFDRDCAVDKHGKKYTIEELKEQIKE